MATIPARTITSSPEEHVADHDEIRELHNTAQYLDRRLRLLFEGQYATVWGHSWTYSDSENTPSARWVNRVQRALGLRWFRTLGHNGSSMQDVANYIIRDNNGPRQFWGIKGLYVVQAGTLELITPDANSGNVVMSTRQQRSCEENLRAALAILTTNIGARDEVAINSNGWTASGTWSSSSNQAVASAGTHIFTTAVNSSVVKTIASAGDYWVFLKGMCGTHTGFPGGVAEILVNGVVQHTVDLEAASWDAGGNSTSDWGQVARKVTVPAGGSLSIRKSDATTNFVVVDFVVPAAMTTPPVVVFQRDCLGTQGQWDAYVTATNLALADFPAGQVLLSELRDSEWNAATMIGADQVHPNDLGQEHIANKFLSTLAAEQDALDPARMGSNPTFGDGPLAVEYSAGPRTLQAHERAPDHVVRYTGAATGTFNLPGTGEVIPTGWRWDIYQWGAGRIQLNANGRTLRAPKGLLSAFQYGHIVVTCMDGTSWLAEGDLAVT